VGAISEPEKRPADYGISESKVPEITVESEHVKLKLPVRFGETVDTDSEP